MFCESSLRQFSRNETTKLSKLLPLFRQQLSGRCGVVFLSHQYFPLRWPLLAESRNFATPLTRARQKNFHHCTTSLSRLLLQTIAAPLALLIDRTNVRKLHFLITILHYLVFHLSVLQIYKKILLICKKRTLLHSARRAAVSNPTRGIIFNLSFIRLLTCHDNLFQPTK